MKEIDKTRNYLIEEVKQNELISEKHKKVFRILKYAEHLLILASIVTGCVSISVLSFSVVIPVGIAITAGIKTYKSIIKKKKKKHDEIVLLAKNKLNTKGILISKALIDSNISDSIHLRLILSAFSESASYYSYYSY